MGDNKISEAAVNEPLQVFSKGTWLYDVTGQQFTAEELDEVAFLAYSPHLQGEAVPVAFVDLANWKAGIGADECFFTDWQDDDTVPLYLHVPTEMGEASGNSGELPPLPEEVSFGHSANGRPYLGYNAEQMQDYARAALAATGKQQVGEVQGSDFDIDDLRELFEKHAKGRGLTPDTWGASSYVDPYVDNDWNEWVAAWKAIASRQPVGAQAVDLGRFREAVRYASGVCPHEDLAAKLRELLALIDGRDAGAGVE